LATVLSTVVTPVAEIVSAIRADPGAVLLVRRVNVSLDEPSRRVATPLASLIVALIKVVVTEDESAVAEVASQVKEAGIPPRVTETLATESVAAGALSFELVVFAQIRKS
jgi:hypothetical protein